MEIELFNLILTNVTSLIMLIISMVFIFSPLFRKSLVTFIRLFLYRESSNDYELKDDNLQRLEEKIKDIEKNLTKNVLQNKTNLIEREVNKYISENLQNVIAEKVNDGDLIKNTVISNLKNDINALVTEYLNNRSAEDIQRTIELENEIKRKEYSHRSLVRNLESEARSAAMLKMVMINLFVVSTAGFLIFNIVLRPEFATNAYVAIVGLYFSLGAFMLYIIRTSHFRSSVLIAIKEDERNYFNVIDYLTSIRSGKEPTESDVDIIRMIMTNRAEREHKAQHPYEVIMKGVSGTNIQFKGGKMQLGGGDKK